MSYALFSLLVFCPSVFSTYATASILLLSLEVIAAIRRHVADSSCFFFISFVVDSSNCIIFFSLHFFLFSGRIIYFFFSLLPRVCSSSSAKGPIHASLVVSSYIDFSLYI